jgi:hypothetical protein
MKRFFLFAIQITSLFLSSASAGSAWGDISYLGTRWRTTCDRVWTVNSLVISTTVRVIDRIHCHTADLGVGLAACLGPVVSSTGLHQRLLGTAMASQDANGCTA